jgi:hypothetical protein
MMNPTSALHFRTIMLNNVMPFTSSTGIDAEPPHNRPYQTRIMAKFLELAVWIANGLTQHSDSLKMFLYTRGIDV